ncbi:ankyrin repeat-containing protein [Anaeramoeba ignava]|uniref:Ankyrin repeat-containing protein n=1 Tax=Anaeramoeba ignava TaxID=1746090 RepID=A0A9Q0LIS5_ANAIG|nr:ankyrin repeat-containing protein [Anaeramoeba ignava]
MNDQIERIPPSIFFRILSLIINITVNSTTKTPNDLKRKKKSKEKFYEITIFIKFAAWNTIHSFTELRKLAKDIQKNSKNKSNLTKENIQNWVQNLLMNQGLATLENSAKIHLIPLLINFFEFINPWVCSIFPYDEIFTDYLNKRPLRSIMIKSINTGNTPLHCAILSRNYNSVEILLRRLSANSKLLNIQNSKGENAFHTALKLMKYIEIDEQQHKLKIEIIKNLAKYHFDYSQKTKKGRNVLHVATKYCNEEILKVLIDRHKEANLDLLFEPDGENNTPFANLEKRFANIDFEKGEFTENEVLFEFDNIVDSKSESKSESKTDSLSRSLTESQTGNKSAQNDTDENIDTEIDLGTETEFRLGLGTELGSGGEMEPEIDFQTKLLFGTPRKIEQNKNANVNVNMFQNLSDTQLQIEIDRLSKLNIENQTKIEKLLQELEEVENENENINLIENENINLIENENINLIQNENIQNENIEDEDEDEDDWVIPDSPGFKNTPPSNNNQNNSQQNEIQSSDFSENDSLPKNEETNSNISTQFEGYFPTFESDEEFNKQEMIKEEFINSLFNSQIFESDFDLDPKNSLFNEEKEKQKQNSKQKSKEKEKEKQNSKEKRSHSPHSLPERTVVSFDFKNMIDSLEIDSNKNRSDFDIKKFHNKKENNEIDLTSQQNRTKNKNKENPKSKSKKDVALVRFFQGSGNKRNRNRILRNSLSHSESVTVHDFFNNMKAKNCESETVRLVKLQFFINLYIKHLLNFTVNEYEQDYESKSQNLEKYSSLKANQLLFWFHVHNYQQFCLLWEDSIAKIHAEYIINNFLKEDSQNTINIPQEIQQNILSQLNQMGENPVATLFDEALKIVHSSLISDKILHYRFLRSLHYKELLSEINEYKGLSSQNKNNNNNNNSVKF